MGKVRITSRQESKKQIRPALVVALQPGPNCRPTSQLGPLTFLGIRGTIPDLQSFHLGKMVHNLGSLTKSVVAFISHDSLTDLINHHP